MSAVLKESPLLIDMLNAAGPEHPVPAQRPSRALAAPEPSSGPMPSALAFLRAGGTVAEMRDVLALQREWEAGEAKKAYVAAMAEFKKNPPTILKDKHVHFDSKKEGATKTDYWHATLGNVAEAIIEGLARVGVSHSWKPERIGDRVHVTCTLTHAQGHSESISLDGPLDNSGNKNNIQQMASTTTYLSRYTLLMITGLAVKDEILPDDDGGAGKRDDGDPPFDIGGDADPLRSRTAEAKHTYPADAFEKNLPTWRGLINAGKKTAAQIIATVESKAPLTAEQKAQLTA